MKNFKIKPISLMIMGAALLTGCAATQKAEEKIEAGQKSTNEAYLGSYTKSSVAGTNDELNKKINFGKTARNWVEPNPLERVEAVAQLPEMFRKNISMTMPGTVNAIEVLSEMQRSTGIKFNINQDIYDTVPSTGKLITPTGGGGAAQKPTILLIPDFVYRGSLQEALNLFASKANVSWKWNGREIEIFKFETKTYNIAALAGSTKTSSSVDLKGDTGGSVAEGAGSQANSGSAASNVSRSSTLTTWDEIKGFLLSQLSPNGSLAVLESAGVVTIKDVPAVHKNINKSISDLNTLLSKQIFLNVDVYSVSVTESDAVSIDWNLAWASASGRNNVNYGGIGGSANLPNSLSIGVLTGPFSGSQIAASALSSIGKTTLVNQFQVTTLNGQPTPIASNKKTGYLKEVKVTDSTTDGGEPKYELVPGEISSGINMNITPKIEPSGSILVEYSMNISELEGLRPFEAPGGASIEIPTSSLKSVLQRASLRSGQTLVLSGFKQNSANYGKSGLGSPSNIALGGKRDAEVSDQYLVVMVTPYIANNNTYFKR
jgi:type IVB pilus formation R64 PilN family outer membrane protein